MYLTAHRVKSRQAAVGISVFLHVHSSPEYADLTWELPDVTDIAQSRPGVLVSHSYDLPPGGNSVLSYLDIAAADDASAETIEGALSAFRTRIPGQEAPIVVSDRGVGIQFSAVLGLADRLEEEFDELRGRALSLFRSARNIPGRAEPLASSFTVDSEGYHFRLDEGSVERVRQAHPTGFLANAVLHISHDVLLNFETAHGDIFPHVATQLSNMRMEQVVQLGGMIFRSDATGKVVRRLGTTPARQS